MNRVVLICFLGSFVLTSVSRGEDPPDTAATLAAAAEDPAHQELRQFRKQVVDAINGNNVDELLKHLTENVVVTWQNAEVSHGPAEVRQYYDRMMKGPDAIVKSLTTNPVPDQLTQLFGDSGSAHGASDDHFILTDGRDFTIKSVWSATVVKQDGVWKIASFHASANIFDNPILRLVAKQTAIWVGAAAVVVGAVLGMLVMWFVRRRKGAAYGAG